MMNLSQKFRRSFLPYSKNPHNIKNKENLVKAAFAIYEDAAASCGLDPRKYAIHMYNIIKPAIHGIKISPDITKTLNDFICNLRFSDLKSESQASDALDIVHYLTGQKKSCLREVINNFLILQDKLDKEDVIITNRNFNGSFFLNNSDVTKVRGKKSVIDNLIKLAYNEVFDKAGGKDKNCFPISVNQKIQYIESHIDSLSEEQCDEILTNLLQKINLILNAQANPDDIKENAENMTDSEKRSALMIHSFNDNYFFTFFAKIVKTIQEALGIKTSAERLLKNSIDEAAKVVGVTLRN